MFIILDFVIICILLIFLILTGILSDADVAVFVAVMYIVDAWIPGLTNCTKACFEHYFYDICTGLTVNICISDEFQMKQSFLAVINCSGNSKEGSFNCGNKILRLSTSAEYAIANMIKMMIFLIYQLFIIILIIN